MLCLTSLRATRLGWCVLLQVASVGEELVEFRKLMVAARAHPVSQELMNNISGETDGEDTWEIKTIWKWRNVTCVVKIYLLVSFPVTKWRYTRHATLSSALQEDQRNSRFVAEGHFLDGVAGLVSYFFFFVPYATCCTPSSFFLLYLFAHLLWRLLLLLCAFIFILSSRLSLHLHFIFLSSSGVSICTSFSLYPVNSPSS
jgi:hypothetical protein